MDALDVCTFHILYRAVKRQHANFIYVNTMYTYDQLRILMVIYYHIQIKGTCYELDVLSHERSNSDSPKERSTALYLSSLHKSQAIKCLPKSKDNNFGRPIEITLRGLGVIEGYSQLFIKAENDMGHRIKKTRGYNK